MKKIYSLALFFLVLESCVSSITFKEIEENYAQLKLDHSSLQRESSKLLTQHDSIRYYYRELSIKLDKREQELENKDREIKNKEQELESKKKGLEALQNSYTTLEQNSGKTIQASIEENRSLLEKIQIKESELLQGQSELDSLQKSLASKIERIDELEQIIFNKESFLNQLKSSLNKALLNFEGKGLTVVKRDGKVYVSMENKLLFKSGSWTVGVEGRQVIKQLSKALEQNKDITILIEGHTDNDPYIGEGNLKGNWDLSTKRATSIVHLLLENKNILPKNIIAAGRGEFSPIAPNDSPKSRAKNRRIEVILSPKLDEIENLLQSLE